MPEFRGLLATTLLGCRRMGFDANPDDATPAILRELEADAVPFMLHL